MALARTSEWWLCEFKVQNLADTAWAFAMVGHLDERLFVASARTAGQRPCEFIAEDLANTAWAFAKAGQ